MAYFTTLNALYSSFSMLFNLLLANIAILLCFFFLFLVIFNSFFTVPLKSENSRPKLAFSIPTGALVTVENDAIEMPPVITDKKN